ncbi:MAG: menaquinone biosynthesis protein [Bacteroidetes bacterium]|nr:menaquinone biosynthesis protein [Bacteroidota bacterium]
MDRKIRVGAVSYLNTKPLLYGIQHSPVIHDIELSIDYPSRIASALLNDEIDVGLVPVAIIPKLNEYYINTNYCIGANGAVASVCLFSETPLEKIEQVLLDYQSRTSVQLAKILLKEYWKIEPELIDAKEDFREHIKGTTAGIVIGDRALEQRRISPYIYDLGEAWKNFTQLPFVFAAWVSNKKLPEDFVIAFNEANKKGIENIDAALKELQFPVFDLHQYYTKYIDYSFDADKQKGLKLFLGYLQKI